MRRILLLLAVLPLWAADDANAILRRFIDAEDQNHDKAKNYTYVGEAVYFTRDTNGQPHRNRSETFEAIFIEGFEYKKLVARNGKPINAKEQSKVQKDMRLTAEQRRLHPTPPPGRITNGRETADLPSGEDLLTLFDNRVAGQEEVAGRKAWVIESTPQAGHVPVNEHEKAALSFSSKLWIDAVESVALRLVYTAIGEHIFLKPGSTITADFQKVNQDVWQLALLVADARRLRGNVSEPGARTEYHFSKFQKFDVQSTITIDPPK
jgi:hypothetical protein